MPAPLIEVDAVSKSFDIPSVRRETVREHLFGVLEPRKFERLQVLDRISFELKAGETLGIMGRNGCGKSTLLKILCGIYTPDAGARQGPYRDYADSRAWRRVESGTGRHRQRVPDRHGDGPVASGGRAPVWTTSWHSPKWSGSPG